MIDHARDSSKSILPSGWLFFAVVPLLPFLLGVGVMQLMAPTNPLGLLETLPVNEKNFAFGHLGDRLIFAAAACVQIITCLGAMFLYTKRIRQLDTEVRSRAYCLLFVTMAIATCVGVLVRVSNAAAYQLTFNVVRQLLLQGPAVSKQFAAEGFFLWQSRIFFSAMAPFVLGAAVVVFGAVLGAMVAVPNEEKRSNWETGFTERVKQLQSSFQISSSVLVTSSVALMLFVQLPAGLMEKPASEAMSRFALGLTVYWGAVMTLTLLAGFALPVLALRQEAIKYHQKIDTRQPFHKWLEECQDFSMKRHLMNLATMLAPVMVGPLGSVLQSVVNSS